MFGFSTLNGGTVLLMELGFDIVVQEKSVGFSVRKEAFVCVLNRLSLPLWFLSSGILIDCFRREFFIL